MPDFSQVKNNSKRLLDYISALAKRRQKCIDNFESHSSWHKYKSEFMNPNNEVLPGIQFQPTEDRQAWIIIERLEKKNPPNFHNKDILTKWNIKIPNDPNKKPQPPKERIVNSAEQIEIVQWIDEDILRQDNITCPADDGSFDVRFLWEDDKNAQQEFKEYLDKWWQPWQLLEKPRRKTIEIYTKLHPICINMKSPDEEYPVEVVFAVGIAQKWENRDVICKNPVIEQIVEIKLEEKSANLIIYPNENRQPIISLQSYQNNPNITQIKEKLEESLKNEKYELNPFDDTTFSPIIEKARAVLDEQAVLSDNAVLSEKPEMLSFYSEWAIFIRQRDDSQILIRTAKQFNDNIEQMEDFSDFPDVLTRIAGGLEIADEVWSSFSKTKQTVINGDIPTDNDRSNKSTENLYFPLPYNEQQKEIIHTLSRENCSGMVVQGPPGTGKSHTIANIICHCLATGKRVLVASHDIPALEVLEEKIPEGIRDLVIPVLSKDSDGKKKIGIALNRLLSISHDTDPQEIAKDIKNKEYEEAQLKNKITLTKKEIIELANQQIEKPPDFLISGLNLQDDISITESLAKWVVSAMPEFDWFKDRPSPDNFGNLPFDNSDIEQLRSARGILGGDLRHTGKKFPIVETLPAPERVRDWHKNLLKAAQIEQNMNDGDIARFSESSFDIIPQAKNIKEKLEKLIQAYNDFSNATWINNLPITDTEQGNYPNLRKELKHLSQQYGKIINNGVVSHSNLPAVVNNSHILDILDKKSKNKLAWGYAFPTKTKKDINNFRINEQSPKSPEDWKHLYSFTSWLLKCQAFITQWNANVYLWTKNDDIKAPSIKNINTIAEWLNEKNRAITGAETAIKLKKAINPLLEDLFQDNTTGMITEITGIERIIKSIDGNIDKIKMEQDKNEIDLLSDNLGDTDISTNMRRFLCNIVGNPEGSQNIDIEEEWENHRRNITNLQGKQEYFNTVFNVTEKINDAGAVKWATILKEQAAEQEIDSLLPHNWKDIWQWSCADKWLEERESAGKIKNNLNHLRDIEDRRKIILSEIVKLRASQSLKSALNNNPVAVQNINTFINAINRIPIGQMALNRPFYLRMAREAMKKCYPVIPCWIMPSWRANEMLPAEMGAFDLVIMDEASQSDITEVITLMRSKKTLIVGDDKQVSPTVIGRVEDMENMINTHIIGLPNHQMLHPQHSLYDIALTIYTQPIILKEHFRCAEPIIAFSSRNFYDDQIIPLRVPKTTERIPPPLIDVFVEDGVRLASENKAEANAIANEIISIRENTNLRCRSIGVISLVGYAQARCIYNLLSEKMGINHGIQCGTAATFQGKECDIIFLSMVVSPDDCRVATNKQTQQRYNVATSRARDRLYLYRSVEANNLNNPRDLKAILLNHFRNPMPYAQNIQAADLCQSGFEREFFTKLVKSGYVATPQVGSRGYKIDIVVEGENGNRLAIELDGDIYHQDWEKDFNRQQILERVGWRFWRCFASSYYRKKEEVFQDLLNTLEESDIYPWEPTESDTTQYVEHRSVKGMENKEEGTDGTKQFAL